MTTRRFDDGFWFGRACQDSASPASGADLTAWQQSRWESLRADPAADDDPETIAERSPWAWRSVLGDRPLAVQLPDPYESNYPYPLIVWLHGPGGSEQELHRLMPSISMQNYVGLAFRGPAPAGTEAMAAPWSLTEAETIGFERDLYETVCAVRRQFHVHSERIYLAGFDAGATLALWLLLRRPEWYAGAIALAGRLPETPQPLARFRDLQRKPVLVAGGARDRSLPIKDVVNTGRLLHASGMSVTTRIYDSPHEVTPAMLADVNHWVMGGIESTVGSRMTG